MGYEEVLEKLKKNRPMIDPLDKIEKSRDELVSIYGEELVNALHKHTKYDEGRPSLGFLGPELFGKFVEVRRGPKKPDPNPKRIAAGKKAAKTRAKNKAAKEIPTGLAAVAAEAQRVDLKIPVDEPELEMCDPNQFMKVYYRVLQSPGWRSLRGLEGMLLLELMKRVITSKKQKDSYGLYHEFYKRGYLACCAKQKELAQWFGVSQQNISKTLLSLERKGYVQKHENPKFKNAQVLVVGITTDSCEQYYLEL
jgi:hypothetical protein